MLLLFVWLCSDLAEKCVQEVSKAVAERCAEDIALIDAIRQQEPSPQTPHPLTGLPARVPQIPTDYKPFVRMSYDEAIAALQRSGEAFHTPPVWGKRLATEHEQWLAGTYTKGRPVFVMHFPTTAASFYARENDTPSPQGPTAATFDLLTSAGELIGGGIREERLDRLQARMVHPTACCT